MRSNQSACNEIVIRILQNARMPVGSNVVKLSSRHFEEAIARCHLSEKQGACEQFEIKLRQLSEY
jgi:hypothetical protein